MRTVVRAVLAMVTLVAAMGGASEARLERLYRPRLPKEGVPADWPADVREAIQCLYTTDGSVVWVERMHGYALQALREAGGKARVAAPLLLPMLGDEGTMTLRGGCPGHAGEVAGILKAMGGVPLDPVLPLFTDKDSTNRKCAAAACKRIRDPRAVEPLIGALKDTEVPVRYEAARALGAQGEARAVAPLAAALKDKNEDVRRAVVLGLGDLAEPECVPALIEALKDRDAPVRCRAVQALSHVAQRTAGGATSEGAGPRTHDPRIVEALFGALKDGDAAVRVAAVSAVSQTSDPRVTPALLSALQDEHALVRVMAAATLSETADLSAVWTLIARSGDTVWQDESVPGRASYWAVTALADGLEARDEYVQAAAAGPRPTDPRALTTLITALRDKKAYVRVMAAAGLSQPTEARAIEALIAALKDSDAGVKEQAAKSLRHVADPRVVEALIAALGDREALLRARAAQSLEGVKEPKAVEALVAALEDESPAVRASAALSLGRLDDAKTTEAIVRTLAGFAGLTSQWHYPGRWRLSVGARRMTGGLEVEYLRQQLVRPEAVGPLVLLLDDPNSSNEVAFVAATALGDIGDRHATVALGRALGRDAYPASYYRFGRGRKTKYDDWERADLAAALALAKIGDPEAVLGLKAALRDRDTPMKYCAAEALSSIGDRRAAGALAAAMQVDDRYLRVQAARGLRKISGQEFTGFEPEKWQQWWSQHKAEYEQVG